MRVAVTGATGTIGSALVDALLERGDDVTALSRNTRRAQELLAGAPGNAEAGAPEKAEAGAPEKAEAGAPEKAEAGALEVAAWADPKAGAPPLDALRGRDAIVHLLGEQIAQRWSDRAKREIRESRVLSTCNLVRALGELPEDERPKVLISQSGVGWYGFRGDERLDESAPAGDDFLARLSVDWEAEARRAEDLGVRVVLNRTGMVLSESGALAKMLPFFKAGVGGPVAGGTQYVAWVHLDDEVGAILLELDTEAASGPVNLTAPDPPTNREFSKALGRVLRRPAVAPVPALAVKALYGEMASIVITGQRALPAKLTELGYRFRHPDLEEALRDVQSSRAPRARRSATGSTRAGS